MRPWGTFGQVTSGIGNSIGGITIGSAGTGIYTGYTLSGGDDFNGALSVVSAAAQHNQYFATRVQRPPPAWPGHNARSRTPNVVIGYQADAQHTGYLDSNRGVPPGTWDDAMTQSASNLVLKARLASGPEQALFDNVGTETMLMPSISTEGYFIAQPPCVIEYNATITSLAPYASPFAANGAGFGFSGWLLEGSPANNMTGWEWDFEIINGNVINTNWNQWSSGTDIAQGNAGGTAAIDTNTHTYTWELLATGVNYYVDGVQVGSKVVKDLTLYGNRPFYLVLANETWATTYNSGRWTSIGNTGVPVNVDWIRFWRNTGTTHRTSLVTQADVNVDFNTPFTITLSDAVTTWGDTGVTDVLEMLQNDAIDPSGQGQQSTTTWMPAGVTYVSNVVSGTISDRPGAIYFNRTGTKPGETCAPLRFTVNVGPTVVTPSTVTLVNGQAFSYDVYEACPCGTLLPKTLTCTGLPTGLSFSPSTGLITGTPTVNGNSTVAIGVTNSNGQSVSANITFTVQAAAIFGIDQTLSGSGKHGQYFNTSQQNTLICLAIFGSGNTSITSVSDIAGLTWTQRATEALGVAGDSYSLWYASSTGILVNDLITAVPASGNVSGMTFTLFSVANANLTTPFDVNGSLPAATNGTSAKTLSQTISTTNANDMLIAMVVSKASLGTITRPSVPTAFTKLTTISTSQDISYDIVSGTQSSVTETYSWTGTTTSSAMIVDAIQSN